MFNDTSIVKKILAHVDFKDKNVANVRFVKVNCMPAVGEPEHLTANYVVDEAFSHRVDESSLIKLDIIEEITLDEQVSIFFSSTLTFPKTITEIATEA